MPIALDIFEAHGYSQKQVAGASAAMFSIVICSGNAMGPPLGGILIQALDGLPSTATAYFCLCMGVAVPLNGLLVYKYAKRPEKGCAARTQAPSEEEAAAAKKFDDVKAR